MSELIINGMPLDTYSYNFQPNLHVICAYFNPAHYETRRTNYQIFSALMRNSGIPLLTVECAFGDDPFDLPESPEIIRVRSSSILWQKERLLNLALGWLPSHVRYVAWLDCDIIFLNQNWARDTAHALERSSIVQVFNQCDRLPEDCAHRASSKDICDSFGSITTGCPDVLKTGRFQDHGHTGYGWAARRDLLDQHGFYEYAIAGSGDHYIAHAAYGDFNSPCLRRLMMEQPTLLAHFREWARPFHHSLDVKGVASIPGTILHLWHGNLADRRYQLRHIELAKLQFNPYLDLMARPGHPLEFTEQGRRPELVEWFRGYFESRKEDSSR